MSCLLFSLQYLCDEYLGLAVEKERRPAWDLYPLADDDDDLGLGGKILFMLLLKILTCTDGLM